MSTTGLCRAKLAELSHVLKEETKLLRSGHLAGHGEIMASKVRHMNELEALVGSLQGQKTLKAIIPQIEKVNRFARENMIMLRSVLSGIKSAQNNIRALDYEDTNVGAYDRSGQKITINDDHGRKTKLV